MKELEEAIEFLRHIKESQKDLESCKNTNFYKNENKAIETVLNYIENSIPKQKVEEAIEKARTKMFSTRVMNEQEMYFLDKCVNVINDMQNDLLEGK